MISTATHAGYLSSNYARAFAHLGEPRLLDACNAYLLESKVPGSADFDAASLYPLFCAAKPEACLSDLRQFELTRKPVSIRLITDPLMQFNVDEYGSFFQILREYKQHCVVRLDAYDASELSANHARNVRKWQKSGGLVTRHDDHLPAELANIWCEEFYPNLIRRHQISSVADFPHDCLRAQLQVPGLTAFTAYAGAHQSVPVGMCLFYQQGEDVYYHLGAYSDAGYQASAAFGIFFEAIEYFAKGGLRYLLLGSGAGTESASAGLFRFKSGWANEMKTNYVLGRISDPDRYNQLISNKPQTPFFPAYRQ